MKEVGKVKDAHGYDRRVGFDQRSGEVYEISSGFICDTSKSLGVSVKTPGDALAAAKALLQKKTG